MFPLFPQNIYSYIATLFLCKTRKQNKNKNHVTYMQVKNLWEQWECGNMYRKFGAQAVPTVFPQKKFVGTKMERK